MLNLKKGNGITLIALIITIIVMIILVAVTVNVALNGGLFNTSKDAAIQTEMETIRERAEVVKANLVAESETNENIKADITTLRKRLAEEFDGIEGIYKVIVENGKYDIKILNTNLDLEVVLHNDEDSLETFKFNVTDIGIDGELYGKYIDWQFTPAPEDVLIENGELTKEKVVDGCLTIYINGMALQKAQQEGTNPVIYYTLDEWLNHKEDLQSVMPESFPDISNITNKEEFYKAFMEATGETIEEDMTMDQIYDGLLESMGNGMSMYEIYSQMTAVYIYKDGVLEEVSAAFNYGSEDRYLIDNENKRNL